MTLARTPPAPGEDGAAQPGRLRPPGWAALADAEGGIADIRGHKVRAVRFPSGPWTIVLDTVSDGESQSTRMRVDFTTRSPLTLSIQRHNALTRLGVFLGMRDVAVPAPDIDGAFLVRTDSPSVIGSLSLDRAFRSALLDLKAGRLEVAPVRRGLRRRIVHWQVRWVTSGVEKRADALAGALRLMRPAVAGLARLGVMRAPVPEDGA